MGDHISRMKKTREISATVKGANEHCTKVFQKTLGGKTQKTKTGDPAPKTPTESDMDMKITKALLGLNDAARGYAAGLEEDKLKSFLELDADARQAEVDAHVAAEKAKTEAAAEEEKKKAAGDPEVNALREKVASMEAERTADKAKARDTELREIAKTKYPAVPKAFETLKAADKLPEEDRAPILANLEATQQIAKNLKTTFGDEEADEGSAKVKFDALVDETAKTKSISKSVAYSQVAADPANAQLVREMRAEMAG